MTATEKGNFQTGIAQDVIDDALKSVEQRTRNAPEPGAPAEGAAEPTPGPPAGAPAAEAAAPQPSPEQRELEAVRAQLEFSQAKGRELLEKYKEEHEIRLRALADLDNFRKRLAREKDDAQKLANEKLLKDVLPVLDNLERALGHARSAADFDSLVKGLQMTRKSFEDALARHGVKAFSTQGTPFDPMFHEAMQQVETGDMPPNHVFAEVLRGYMLHDRLARPALVMVSKAPQAAEPAGEGSGEGSAGRSPRVGNEQVS